MTARGLAAVGALLAIGCSDVFIEPGGGGGAGGAGGRPGTGSQDSSVSTTVAHSSSSTGFDPALNAAFCEVTGMCFPSCTVAFQTFQYPPCEAEGLALVTCFLDHYDQATCTLSGCEAEIQVLSTCRADGSYSCGFGGGCNELDYYTCDSNSVCTDGERWVLCSRDEDQAECACYFNSVLFGTCTGSWEDGQACSLRTGCCTALFGACPLCPC